MAATGVFVSSGHNYAIEPVRALGLSTTEGVVRAGFVHYHSVADVERTFATLADIAGSGSS
jgi:selenocysteine lyase/cysteine desulfurase